jgi:hypothetical protein
MEERACARLRSNSPIPPSFQAILREPKPEPYPCARSTGEDARCPLNLKARYGRVRERRRVELDRQSGRQRRNSTAPELPGDADALTCDASRAALVPGRPQTFAQGPPPFIRRWAFCAPSLQGQVGSAPFERACARRQNDLGAQDVLRGRLRSPTIC